jgi:TetR/AcrR family transcriptional regulator, mexJK operon transcriptional repressor
MTSASQLKLDPPTRRELNAADKQRAILNGARSVFMAHGFGGASMDAIADCAAVSKMTLYRYFESKEALFAGLIEESCAKILQQDPAVPLEGLAPREALRRFGMQLLETVYAPETLALHRIVLAEVNRFPELGRLFYRSGPEKNIEAVARYIESYMPGKVVPPRDSRKCAEEFFELVRGYRHLRLLLGIEKTPDACIRAAQVDRAVDTFFRTL